MKVRRQALDTTQDSNTAAVSSNFAGKNEFVKKVQSYSYVPTRHTPSHKMLSGVFRIISLACFLTIHSTEQFRQYERIAAGERFSHVHRFIRSLAAGKLRCAVICTNNADCDSIHYNSNTSSVSLNCELLMTSETDNVTLTPAADWSIWIGLERTL